MGGASSNKRDRISNRISSQQKHRGPPEMTEMSGGRPPSTRQHSASKGKDRLNPSQGMRTEAAAEAQGGGIRTVIRKDINSTRTTKDGFARSGDHDERKTTIHKIMVK
ncbi:hypothetical protein FOPE_07736 [Fonsecaea pedrosoi]|nr:hypothetical protein FOPE_07736 [Fonsecaea pedrosoi]